MKFIAWTFFLRRPLHYRMPPSLVFRLFRRTFTSGGLTTFAVQTASGLLAAAGVPRGLAMPARRRERVRATLFFRSRECRCGLSCAYQNKSHYEKAGGAYVNGGSGTGVGAAGDGNSKSTSSPAAASSTAEGHTQKRANASYGGGCGGGRSSGGGVPSGDSKGTAGFVDELERRPFPPEEGGASLGAWAWFRQRTRNSCNQGRLRR